MARISKVLYVFYVIFKGVASFLTIGWADKDQSPSALCQPDHDLSVTTDYIKLYSGDELRQAITAPCYCSLSPRDHNDSVAHWAVMIIAVYNDHSRMFDNWLEIKGAGEWGMTGKRDSLYFKTTDGENAALYLPHLDRSLPLNSTVYITITNATVHMHCSTQVYIIPTEDETHVMINATTMEDHSTVVKWYHNTRLLVIVAVAALTLLITVIILAIVVIRKRRKKKPPEVLLEIQETDWRVPGVVAREGTSRNKTDSFAEVDTYIDADDSKDSDGTATTSSKKSKEKSLKKQKTSDKTVLPDVNDRKKSEDIIKPNTEETVNLLPPSGTTSVSNSNPPPDLLTRGEYDNLMKSNVSPDNSDSYIKPDANIAKSTGEKTDANKNDTDSFKGIDEIPEYAEIEEMQMLLKKPLPVKDTNTSKSNATPVSDASSNGNKAKKPGKKFKLFGRNKDKAKDKEPLRDKKETPKHTSGKKGDSIKLTDLDFNQLKDAIDKMDPSEVKETMKQVAESPSVVRKDPTEPVEHIYTNTPPPKPPRASEVDDTKKNANLVAKQDDLIKYDSPRNSQQPAPEVTNILNSIKRPKMTLPLDTALSNSQIPPVQPASPRSKWGAPVSELYAQPEKPSRLPRPTSPSPQSTPGASSSENKPPGLKQTPLSSYHVPKTFTPTSSTQRPMFSPINRFSSKPETTNSTSAFKGPSSPSSPSALKSLGLVVKATEALQSPSKPAKHTSDIKPASAAFSSAYNRFKDMNPEPPPSRNPLLSGINSPSPGLSDKTRVSLRNTESKPVTSGYSAPYSRFKPPSTDSSQTQVNKPLSTAVSSPYNRFKAVRTEPSIYDNKQSLTASPSNKIKPTATEPSLENVGYKSSAWNRPASPKMDSPRQNLQVRSQFRI